MNSFDILIVGGGHAGVEASYIASQFNLKIALISMPGVPLASAPCNPSVGGVGKGQVVREIDALGGLMPIITDLSGIQYRTLNESKGYAVQSTRVQIDKNLYSENAEKIILSIPNLKVIREKVLSMSRNGDGTFEVKTNCSTWNTKSLVMTVGTFLNGKLHCGEQITEGGRVDNESSKELSDFLKSIKLVSNRFKTGTPPRLKIDSIDYSKCEEQESDSRVLNFSTLEEPFLRKQQQISCYLTRTTPASMKIIRDNKDRSPLFNGQIQGIGPRYCPSIEDKAYRYPDKDIHHVFIEKESHSLETVYPSGLSTSLPLDVQREMIRNIEGFENAEILIPGYAVEYDVIDTTYLKPTLEHKDFPGLYFAGQVNGTSGYEEAAGQGLVAGANAALKILNKPTLELSREDSYIGVMVLDLISNFRDEPYRLFSARSENRLLLREDNAILRLSRFREGFGLNTLRDSFNKKFVTNYNIISELLDSTYISYDSDLIKMLGMTLSRRVSLTELVKMPPHDPVKILEQIMNYYGVTLDFTLLRAIAISKKYDGYVSRANEQNIRLSKLNKMKIDWEKIIESKNISFECKLRIKKTRPETFDELKHIEGIRPATLAVVASGAL